LSDPKIPASIGMRIYVIDQFVSTDCAPPLTGCLVPRPGWAAWRTSVPTHSDQPFRLIPITDSG